MADPKQVYEAVWAVLKEWRPGMSDEVADSIARRIMERIAALADT